MPAISSFHGVILRLMKLPNQVLGIYANRGEEEIVVDAGTLRVISGSAPAGLTKLVLEWALLHTTELEKAIQAVQAHRAPCAWTSPA